MGLVRARLREDGVVVQIMPDGSEVPLEDRTDWARVDAMTDEEIERAVAEDPDAAPILSDEEWARAVASGEVVVARPGEVRALRERLGTSQERFAALVGVPVATVDAWEAGAAVPDGTARALLKVIEREPEAVLRALADEPAEAPAG
jgi:putative transcriptional regulator